MRSVVFISHATKDSEHASRLRETLEAQGLTCFLAPKGISPGQDFAAEIRLALLSSGAVCLLATKESLRSEWVTTEWGAAWALGKPLIPVLLRCGPEELPGRLQGVQCIDFHDLNQLPQLLRDQIEKSYATASDSEVLPYASPLFRQHHQANLREHPSGLWLLSYTGETTDNLLLSFEEMMLDMEVRLLTRNWKNEAHAEGLYNASHPNRPRNWAKAAAIYSVARSLPEKPWSHAAGGRVRLEQKFYEDPPFGRLILYVKDNKAFAGFCGFYRYDPHMRLSHPSIYVDVGQPILRTEDRRLLSILMEDYLSRWDVARTIREIEAIP